MHFSPVAAGNEEPEARVPNNQQIWTAVSLVSGTAVGAGILAIASVSLKPGFVPSTITLTGCWVLMACVGLIIAEITCNIAMRDSDAKDFGIISITERIFGLNTARCIGLLYVAFHYTLLIAYIAEAGGILSEVAGIPRPAGPIIFTLCMGGFIACSSADTVSVLNNCLFIVVVMAFLGLVGMGLGSIHPGNLSYQDYSAVGPTVPILLVALVFHNIIPTICAGLLYHRRSICMAIFIGSCMPLMMFILWNAVILGMVSDYRTTAHSDEVIDPVHILLGDHASHSHGFGTALITLFSEAAIITSFIGFVIGLMEFYADTLPGRSKKDLLLYALVLVPPMLVALGNPGIFLRALDAAGAYGISVLFGLLPVALTLRLRYDLHFSICWKQRFRRYPVTVLMVFFMIHYIRSEALKADFSVFTSMPREGTSNILHSPVSTEQSADETDSPAGTPQKPASHWTGSAPLQFRTGPLPSTDPEDGSSRHAVGLELRALEQRGLISTSDASSAEVGTFSAHSPHDGSMVSSHIAKSRCFRCVTKTFCSAFCDLQLNGLDGSTHTGKFSPEEEVAEYVYFLPGGDGALYFMAAVFVGIIIVKLALG
jgi:tyrosine-specific transport protein